MILLVIAMFNDDVATLLQRYVFRRGKTNPAQQTYYDERLYGNGNRRPNQQRPQQPPRERRNPNQVYNADGTPRRPQNSGNRNGNGGYRY